MKYKTLFLAVALAGCGAMPGESSTGMSFFVTSAGSGKGADLGGVKGADQHCQALAKAAGAGNKTWRAYLSESPSTNARERIGNGDRSDPFPHRRPARGDFSGRSAS